MCSHSCSSAERRQMCISVDSKCSPSLSSVLCEDVISEFWTTNVQCLWVVLLPEECLGIRCCCHHRHVDMHQTWLSATFCLFCWFIWETCWSFLVLCLWMDNLQEWSGFPEYLLFLTKQKQTVQVRWVNVIIARVARHEVIWSVCVALSVLRYRYICLDHVWLGCCHMTWNHRQWEELSGPLPAFLLCQVLPVSLSCWLWRHPELLLCPSLHPQLIMFSQLFCERLPPSTCPYT